MSREQEAEAFVLGLMDDTEASRAEAALATDPEWARAVGQARDRFLPLDMTAVPAPVPADLWERIAPELQMAEPKAANLPSTPRLRRLLPASIAAAIALAVGIGIGSQTLRPEPVVIAVLMDDSGAARAVVEDYGSESARVRFVSDVAVPDGQQMQVWTLPSPERGPVSLGLLKEDRAEHLSPPELPTPADGQLYEITLEPLGGSPTGRPTGPILAKGFAARQNDI